MREIDLWLDRAASEFVEGLGSSNPLPNPGLALPKNNGLLFRIHNTVRNTAVPSVVPYLEEPLDFTALRANLILAPDAPPNRGTFCFKVLDDTTAPLTWPTDLSPAGLATWKAATLAALIALGNVGAGQVTIADPPNTPANFFYFTWTDPTRVDVISVVSNRLLPLCQVNQEGSFTPFGYTQLVKISMYPLAMVPASPDPSAFAHAATPVITIEETQHGAAGVNEEWTLIVPEGASGSVAFGWSGAQTNSIALSTLTSAAITSALNAIVANGGANPSFQVVDRDADTGQRYAVQYIGPLAASAQAALAIFMLDQQAQPWATGIMDLTVVGTALAIEQALNGAASAPAILEVVITAAAKDETILLPVLLLNDATTANTEVQATDAGAISVVTKEVVVDNSTLEPFATVAPGVSYAPAVAVAAATVQNIAHNLNTLTPFVWAVYEDSLDPVKWRALQLGGEYSWESTDANHIAVTCPFAITTGPTDQWYFGRLKFFISSPDAVVQIFGTLTMTWAQCLESLPDGQSVAAKFAALDAALGIFGGSLTVNASNITGLLNASQLNIESLGAAFATSPNFLTTMQTLISNATIIKNIAVAFLTSGDFATTLQTLLTTNAALLIALINAILGSNAFTTGITPLILAALQGAVPPANTLPIQLPTINWLYPAANADGSYNELPAAQVGISSLGNLTGNAPKAAASNAGKTYAVVSHAYVRPDRRKTFYDGDVIFSTGNDWYLALFDAGTTGVAGVTHGTTTIDYTPNPAVVPGMLVTGTDIPASTYVVSVTSGHAVLSNAATGSHSALTFTFSFDTAYAQDFEKELFTVYLNDGMLIPNSTFNVLFQFGLSVAGNCEGHYLFELRRGTPQAAGGGSNLTVENWDEVIISAKIILTDATVLHRFGYTLVRTADVADVPQIAATKQEELLIGAATALTSANLAIQARLTHFDTENVPRPLGQVKLTMSGQVASITKLSS